MAPSVRQPIEKERKELSRRDFLKFMGATGGGLALAGCVPDAQDSAKDAASGSPPVLGPDKIPVTLKINGQNRSLQLEPRTTLLNALRNKLDLTGPKEVCDRGACGACTVWLDGTPVNACMTLALDAEGREITTIEGLAKGGQLDPLQENFAEHDGMQCGFCTPGFIMAIRGYLNENPTASIDEIKENCSGNICRCAAYPGIFAAALATVQGKRGLGIPYGLRGEELKKFLDERGMPRIDASEKVKGAAKYTYDQNLPGMLHLRTLNCMFAGAKMEGEPDLAAARAVPGVRHVEIRPSQQGGIYSEGTTVALALAEDPQAADESLAALKIRLAPTTGTVDIEKVIKTASSPKITEAVAKFEDPKQAREHKLFIQTVQHSPLEPHGCVAEQKPESAVVYESTQGVSNLKRVAAQASGLPESQARGICQYMGGGFGCKIGNWTSGIQAAFRYAKQLGTPIKFMLSRPAELASGGGRNPQLIHTLISRGADGKIQILQAQIRIPAEGYGTFPALRAPGAPQQAFISEILKDEEAYLLGQAYGTPSPEVAQAIGWERRQNPAGSAPGPVKRGLGYGRGGFAGSNSENFAEVEVDTETGEVLVKKIVVVFSGGFINKRATESQIYGGTIMGLSWAMFEERVMDPKRGAFLNTNLDFYKIAGSLDIPEIQIFLKGQMEGAGGVGEAPVVPVAGALANAIFNATGFRPTRMPFTPKNILASMGKV
jgi:CO/xanthine dehydrogenase Mo-binding subunit/aerobic-type carbon monoxide dehydrogenase small subunit (CoxS/CutS family)